MPRLRALGVSLIALVALAACDRSRSKADIDAGSAQAFDDPPETPSPADLARVALYASRGQGEACGDALITDHILTEAIASNTYPEARGWTAEQEDAFYRTYTNYFTNIVLNAHDPVAKLVSCGGTYLEERNGASFSVYVEYDVQATVDNQVLVKIYNLDDLQRTARNAVNEYQQTMLQPAIDARQAEENAQRLQAEANNRTALLERANDRCRRPYSYPLPEPIRIELGGYLRDISAPQNDYERSTRACLQRVLDVPPPPPPREDRVEYIGPPVIVPGPPPPPAPPRQPRPSRISNPSWSRQPQPEFPDRARAAGITTGAVSLDCMINPNGTLTDCGVLSENPSGVGFGRAALAAVRSARVSPRSVESVESGGRATFVVRFDDDGE